MLPVVMTPVERFHVTDNNGLKAVPIKYHFCGNKAMFGNDQRSIFCK